MCYSFGKVGGRFYTILWEVFWNILLRNYFWRLYILNLIFDNYCQTGGNRYDRYIRA